MVENITKTMYASMTIITNIRSKVWEAPYSVFVATMWLTYRVWPMIFYYSFKNLWTRRIARNWIFFFGQRREWGCRRRPRKKKICFTDLMMGGVRLVSPPPKAIWWVGVSTRTGVSREPCVFLFSVISFVFFFLTKKKKNIFFGAPDVGRSRRHDAVHGPWFSRRPPNAASYYMHTFNNNNRKKRAFFFYFILLDYII